MKKIKYLKILVLFGVLLNVSCGKDAINLDLTDDPNYLTMEQKDPDYLLNSTQVQFGKIVEKFGKMGAEVTRIYHMSGRFYNAAYTPQTLDDEWSDAYAKLMKDIDAMNSVATEKSLIHHIAIGEVLKAYTLMTLVDFFGDVPNSEAFNDDILYPKPDTGEEVYVEALNLLNDAKSKFETDANAEPSIDLFYNKDWTKWIKLVNTLKMKAYLTIRLVDNNALTNFDDIVTNGEYITSNDEDFQFYWGKNEANPDTRHPRYANSYTSSGGQEYQSNEFMDYMTGPNDNAYLAMDHFDPRTLFYFYRQVSATPGKGGEPADEELLSCSAVSPPPHYAGYTFCGVAKGWWGRDHGNEEGIPPDGFKRTLFGVYPAGGALDDLSYDEKVNGDGFGGSGITPIMLASWVEFMLAERSMIMGDETAAKTHMINGLNLSMDKVTNFKPKTARFEQYFSGNQGMLPTLQTYIDTFKGQIEDDWDNGTSDDRWNILARQYFVALYGNGIDAYNFYRRTGYPHDLQPNLEPNPGGFIRSFYYPANTVNNNPNMSQKDGVTKQVFWDTNPSSPGFPQSN